MNICEQKTVGKKCKQGALWHPAYDTDPPGPHMAASGVLSFLQPCFSSQLQLCFLIFPQT